MTTKPVLVILDTTVEIMCNIVDEDKESLFVDGALKISYDYDEEHDTPVAFFEKYCPLNVSYDVPIKHEHIRHVFRDPTPGLVDRYHRMLELYKQKTDQIVKGQQNDNGNTVTETDDENDFNLEDLDPPSGTKH